IIVNSGNANACTGNQGMLDALAMRAQTAEKLEIPLDSVAVASTGIIGDMLPMDKINAGIEMLEKQTGNAADFEEAILTTDTF
ncbi:bifunctional ornithine acetyltransferase/N-acetylglutamate synthase, partial [Listeria monocytogenes]